MEETIKELKRRGYQTAVVTATAEDRAVRYLEMVGFKELFDEIISASMVKLGNRDRMYISMPVRRSGGSLKSAWRSKIHQTGKCGLTRRAAM